MSEDPTSATRDGERRQLGELGSDEQRLRKENRDEEPEHRRLEREIDRWGKKETQYINFSAKK